MKMLKELFLHQLGEIYDTEQKLARILPKMAEASTCEQVSQTLMSHLEETKAHVTKVEEVFEAFGKLPRAKKSNASAALLADWQSLAAHFKHTPSVNAAIICGAQKLEHHAIATYGCLYQWAGLLENDDAADVIAEVLAEEKAADEELTLLSVLKNQEALEATGILSLEDAAEIPTLITTVVYTGATHRPPGWTGPSKHGH